MYVTSIMPHKMNMFIHNHYGLICSNASPSPVPTLTRFLLFIIRFTPLINIICKRESLDFVTKHFHENENTINNSFPHQNSTTMEYIPRSWITYLIHHQTHSSPQLECPSHIRSDSGQVCQNCIGVKILNKPQTLFEHMNANKPIVFKILIFKFIPKCSSVYFRYWHINWKLNFWLLLHDVSLLSNILSDSEDIYTCCVYIHLIQSSLVVETIEQLERLEISQVALPRQKLLGLPHTWHSALQVACFLRILPWMRAYADNIVIIAEANYLYFKVNNITVLLTHSQSHLPSAKLCPWVGE